MPADEPPAPAEEPGSDELEAADAAAEAGDAAAAEPETADEPDEPEEPALHPEAVELLARIEAELADALVETGGAGGELIVRVRPDDWHRVAEVARARLECDYLSFISGIDWMPRPVEGGDDDAGGDTSAPVQPTETSYGVAGSAGRFQVFARVGSTRRPRWGVVVKTDVDEDDPRIASWADVYPGADWHERETWEMYGFAFDGHPSLRHIYLPAEFEGHPLRKDFPLLAREVKPWPGLVDVEDMPPEPEAEPADTDTEAAAETDTETDTDATDDAGNGEDAS